MKKRVDLIENVLKGKIAAGLVEQLLLLSENRVYPFGFENALPTLAREWDYRRENSFAGKILRSMPDLVVINKRGIPRFVEVKFRSGEPSSLLLKDLERSLRHWSSHVILVTNSSRPFFHVSWLMLSGGDADLQWKPLITSDEWSLDSEVYAKCEDLVEKYLPKI